MALEPFQFWNHPQSFGTWLLYPAFKLICLYSKAFFILSSSRFPNHYPKWLFLAKPFSLIQVRAALKVGVSQFYCFIITLALILTLTQKIISTDMTSLQADLVGNWPNWRILHCTDVFLHWINCFISNLSTYYISTYVPITVPIT